MAKRRKKRLQTNAEFSKDVAKSGLPATGLYGAGGAFLGSKGRTIAAMQDVANRTAAVRTENALSRVPFAGEAEKASIKNAAQRSAKKDVIAGKIGKKAVRGAFKKGLLIGGAKGAAIGQTFGSGIRLLQGKRRVKESLLLEKLNRLSPTRLKRHAIRAMSRLDRGQHNLVNTVGNKLGMKAAGQTASHLKRGNLKTNLKIGAFGVIPPVAATGIGIAAANRSTKRSERRIIKAMKESLLEAGMLRRIMGMLGRKPRQLPPPTLSAADFKKLGRRPFARERLEKRLTRTVNARMAARDKFSKNIPPDKAFRESLLEADEKTRNTVVGAVAGGGIGGGLSAREVSRAFAQKDERIDRRTNRAKGKQAGTAAKVGKAQVAFDTASLKARRAASPSEPQTQQQVRSNVKKAMDQRRAAKAELRSLGVAHAGGSGRAENVQFTRDNSAERISQRRPAAKLSRARPMTQREFTRISKGESPKPSGKKRFANAKRGVAFGRVVKDDKSRGFGIDASVQRSKKTGRLHTRLAIGGKKKLIVGAIPKAIAAGAGIGGVTGNVLTKKKKIDESVVMAIQEAAFLAPLAAAGTRILPMLGRVASVVGRGIKAVPKVGIRKAFNRTTAKLATPMSNIGRTANAVGGRAMSLAGKPGIKFRKFRNKIGPLGRFGMDTGLVAGGSMLMPKSNR